MSEVKIQKMEHHVIVFDYLDGKYPITIIDYGDTKWCMRFGKYGQQFEAKLTTPDIQQMVSILSAMLLDNEQAEAVQSGDANTPWLDEDEDACPVCGGSLPCPKCLNDLRCDDGI